jgi:hypothetical protein
MPKPKAKTTPKCDFAPLITGITPAYHSTILADKDYKKGDRIAILHTFVIEGHHFKKGIEDNIALGNFTHCYKWTVQDAKWLDPCRILVHAFLECIKLPEGTAGAGSGDLTVTASPPPPPPPPPPHAGGTAKKAAETTEGASVENAFTVYYLDT